MRILGVLNGGDMSPAQLRVWAHSAEVVAAADGAANRLTELGVTPNIVVGDMDSIEDATSVVKVLRDADQATTDCDKLLRWMCGQTDGPLTLASCEGDLPDHFLATLSSCVSSGRTVRLVLRRGFGWVFKGGLDVKARQGGRVSLLPLTACSGVDLAGVEWPLSAADLQVGGLVSISNRATGELVRVSLSKGAAFLFVERAMEEQPTWD